MCRIIFFRTAVVRLLIKFLLPFHDAKLSDRSKYNLNRVFIEKDNKKQTHINIHNHKKLKYQKD